jgi:hypothetical protein
MVSRCVCQKLMQMSKFAVPDVPEVLDSGIDITKTLKLPKIARPRASSLA